MNAPEIDILENLFGFYRRLALLSGYRTGTVEGIDYVWNRKGTWPAYLMGNPGPDRIPLIVEAVNQDKAPPFWILEKTGGEELCLLESSGMRVIREWKGMALNKNNLSTIPVNEHIEIRSKDPGINHEWMQIVNNELMTGKRISDGFLNGISGTGQFNWVVAYLDGEAVGTGMSYASEGVAGIYMISTSNRFRGRGVGTEVTRVLTEEALNSGNRMVVLHATGQGEGIYRRLGFIEVNTVQVWWYLGR